MPKVYVNGEGQEVRVKVAFDLNRLEVKIGRAEDNDLVIADDPSISNHHCIIKRVFGGYVIKNLDSSNGIHHKGVKQEKLLIEHGMEIHVGSSPLVFVYKKDELENIQREEQDPRRYVTEADLIELQNQRDGIPVAPTQQLPAEPSQSVQPISPSTGVGNEAFPADSVQQYNTQKTHKGSSSGVGSSLLAFITLILMFALGSLGGFTLKHKQVYDSSFIDDLQAKKIKTVFQ